MAIAAFWIGIFIIIAIIIAIVLGISILGGIAYLCYEGIKRNDQTREPEEGTSPDEGTSTPNEEKSYSSKIHPFYARQWE